MIFWKSIVICARIVYGFFIWAFIGALFLFLLLQIYITVSIQREGFVRIPDALLETVVSEVHPDLWLDHGGAYLNFGGVVSLDSVSIGTSDMKSPILELDEVVLDLDVAMLMLGRVKLDRLVLGEGRLLMPAILSPTGVSEELIELLILDLADVDDVYSLNQAVLRYGELQGWALGEFRIPRLSGGSESEDETEDSLDRLDLETKLRELYDFRQTIDQISDPLVRIRFRTKSPRQNELDVSAFGSATKESIEGVHVGEMSAHASMSWDH